IAGVLFQGVEDPWDGRPVLFGEPRQGRAPLERPMAPYLVAVLDIGRQRAATLRVPRRAGDDRTPAYHRETRVPACHWFADAGAGNGGAACPGPDRRPRAISPETPRPGQTPPPWE